MTVKTDQVIERINESHRPEEDITLDDLAELSGDPVLWAKAQIFVGFGENHFNRNGYPHEAGTVEEVPEDLAELFLIHESWV